MIRLLDYQPVRYYCVGATALFIDVCVFQTLVLLGFVPVGAAALSYGVAGTVHFLSNRIWTFKALHRTPTAQLPTYAGVVIAAWAVTVVVVGACTANLHFSPLAAKFTAIAATVPMGFFGHKYLTFGIGLRSLANHLFAGLVRS